MNEHGPSLLRDQFLLAIRFLPRTGKGAGLHVWPGQSASYDDQDRMAAGAPECVLYCSNPDAMSI